MVNTVMNGPLMQVVKIVFVDYFFIFADVQKSDVPEESGLYL